jgi:hypothetical protein
MEGPAIVDAHYHRLAVGRICHARVGRYRQYGMRRRHAVHVVDFSAGRLLPVVAPAVPGADATPRIGFVLAPRHVVAAERRVWVVGEAMQRLRLRHGIRDRIDIRRVVAGSVVLVATAELHRRCRLPCHCGSCASGSAGGGIPCGRRWRHGDSGPLGAVACRPWRLGATGGKRQGQDQRRKADHFCTSIRLPWIDMRMPMPMNSVTSAVPP